MLVLTSISPAIAVDGVPMNTMSAAEPSKLNELMVTAEAAPDNATAAKATTVFANRFMGVLSPEC